MADEEQQGWLDQAVRLLAQSMNAVGLNGTRLLWKWNRRRTKLAETGVKTENLLRSARAKHKMCPACRALVARGSSSCSECGASLRAVSTPGVGRMVSNILPGITAATSLLMLVNGFWFVMMLMAQLKTGGSGGNVSLFSGFGGELIVRFGSGLSRQIPMSTGELAGGEWWRLVTPIFLNGGLLHFGFNSYLLLHLGPIAEEIYGTTRYWVIYLCCGIAGSVVSQLPRFVNTIGASGAIMGLIGLLLVHGLRHRDGLGQSMKSLLIRLGMYTLIMSLFFRVGIDHFAHIGGFACGALLALIVPRGPFRDRSDSLFWQALSFAGVLLVLLAFYKVSMQGRLLDGG